MNIRTHQFGFTLIELLFYVAIIGSLLIAISLYFAAITETRIKNQSILEVDQQGAFVLDKISQIIRNADGITSPSPGNSASSLVLSTPLNPSQTTINLNGTALQVTEGASSAVSLTSSKVEVSSLTFTNTSRASTPGSVQTTFTLARASSGSNFPYIYQKDFQTSASLRWSP